MLKIVSVQSIAIFRAANSTSIPRSGIDNVSHYILIPGQRVKYLIAKYLIA
jgi:hypothetical protein